MPTYQTVQWEPQKGLSGKPMKPNVNKHNPDADYIRSLLEQSGLSQRQAAIRLGVPSRQMRYYASGEKPCPYPVQFCLECLAEEDN